MKKTISEFLFGGHLNYALLLKEDIIEKSFIESYNFLPSINNDNLVIRPAAKKICDIVNVGEELAFGYTPSTSDIILFSNSVYFLSSKKKIDDIEDLDARDVIFYENYIITKSHIFLYNSFIDHFFKTKINIEFDDFIHEENNILKRAIKGALKDKYFFSAFKDKLFIFGFIPPAQNYILFSETGDFSNMRCVKKNTENYFEPGYLVLKSCSSVIDFHCTFSDRLLFFKGRHIYSFFFDTPSILFHKETCHFIYSSTVKPRSVHNHLFFVSENNNIIYSCVTEFKNGGLTFLNLMAFTYKYFYNKKINNIYPFVHPFLGVLAVCDDGEFYICKIHNSIVSWFKQKASIKLDKITSNNLGDFYIFSNNVLYNLNLNSIDLNVNFGDFDEAYVVLPHYSTFLDKIKIQFLKIIFENMPADYKLELIRDNNSIEFNYLPLDFIKSLSVHECRINSVLNNCSDFKIRVSLNKDGEKILRPEMIKLEYHD